MSTGEDPPHLAQFRRQEGLPQWLCYKSVVLVRVKRVINTAKALHHGRQPHKVHLAKDTDTSDMSAAVFTPSSDGDSPVLPDLLDQIPNGEEVGAVTADRL